MTLFPTPAAKPKSRPKAQLAPRDRAEHRLPSGTPRVVESSNDRIARASGETWQALLAAVRRSATARLMLLPVNRSHEHRTRSLPDRPSSDSSCRCRGAGTVTVDFLRSHYTSLANDIVVFVRRTS